MSDLNSVADLHIKLLNTSDPSIHFLKKFHAVLGQIWPNDMLAHPLRLSLHIPSENSLILCWNFTPKQF